MTAWKVALVMTTYLATMTTIHYMVVMEKIVCLVARVMMNSTERRAMTSYLVGQGLINISSMLETVRTL